MEEIEDEEKFACYEVDSDESLSKLGFEQGDLQYHLNPEKVLLIVRDDVRRIYIWKGARSSVKKRFLASRLAPKLQEELVQEEGYHRCRIKAVDQCNEIKEFLNLFGLESIDVNGLEDKYYYLNSEQEEAKILSKLEEKYSYSVSDEMLAIDKILKSQKKLWIKSSTTRITKQWIEKVSNKPQFKLRLTEVEKNKDLLGREFENKWIITNESIVTYSELNAFYDFSEIPERYLQLEDNIVLLDVFAIKTLTVTKTIIDEEEEYFNLSFNCFPDNLTVFNFADLTLGEYLGCLNIFTSVFSFRAKIPEKVGTLVYIKKE